MPTPNPTTAKELLAALHRGRCSLPTLVVEGPDDMRIYKWVQQELGLKPTEMALLPTNGRDKLLEMYEAVHKNRNLYADVPIVFIADQDMFVFTGIPSDYSGVMFTNGYSIENDLYSSTDLEKLLDSPNEVQEHAQVLDVIIEWFAFEVQEDLAGRVSCVARDLKDIVRRDTTHMDPGFRKTRKFDPPRPFTPPGKVIHDEIKTEYKLKLRGKTLFDLLVRFLNYPGRHTMHDKKVLQEFAFKTSTDPRLKNKLIQDLGSRFIRHPDTRNSRAKNKKPPTAC